MPKQRPDDEAIDAIGRQTDDADDTTTDTPATEAAETGLREAQDLAAANKAQAEKVLQFVVASINALRAELDTVERQALDDCARVKSELDAQITGAETYVRQIHAISDMVQQVRAKRAALLPTGE
jgi:hypothetical protein